MRVVTFNAWQNNPNLPGNLLQLVGDLHAPEVLALQEVTGWRGNVPGYTRIACHHDGHRDATSSQLLIRREGVKLRGHGCVHVGGPDWTGPHGQVHPPRVYPSARISVDGETCRILDVHRAPLRTPGRNNGAWNAEHNAIAFWANRRRLPIIMGGDWNSGPADVASLCKLTDTLPALRGVDGFLVSDTEHFTTRRLPEHYGSDAHRPVVLTIREKTR